METSKKLKSIYDITNFIKNKIKCDKVCKYCIIGRYAYQINNSFKIHTYNRYGHHCYMAIKILQSLNIKINEPITEPIAHLMPNCRILADYILKKRKLKIWKQLTH